MIQSRSVRARGRRVVVGVVASGLLTFLAQGGCAVSDPVQFVLLPDAGSNGTGGSSTGGSSTGGSNATGGTSATGGTNATGGTFATGGSNGSGGVRATGGMNGTGGFNSTGGFTGAGGVTSTGGFNGTGGVTNTGGTTGSGGTHTGGTTGSGGSTGSGGAGGSAATFTQTYQMILTVSCAGSSCHNPGAQSGVSFATQSSAYTAVKSRVVAGNATGSSFYTTVNTGRMPPGGKLSSTQLNMIASWINAGALNN